MKNKVLLFKSCNIGLCHRCEYRAQYKEDNRGPRSECGLAYAIHSCYMYRPVAPVLLEPDKGDPRSPFAPAFISCRSHVVGVAEVNYVFNRVKGKQFCITAEPQMVSAAEARKIKQSAANSRRNDAKGKGNKYTSQGITSE